MSTCVFRSPLAFRLEGFFRTRCAAGRRAVATQKILRYLDRFLIGELKPKGAITREIVQQYTKSIEHLSIGTRINRLGIFRQFCLYLSHFDPRTCIVHRSYLPHRTRPTPHIYTRDEIRKIMAAARSLGPAGTLRPVVISSVIGLLYTTGLRVGEAIRLSLRDVDFNRSVLVIRETKFKKSRYVPISPSCASQLQNFLRLRRRAGFSEAPDSRLFVNLKGNPLGEVAVTEAFLKILRSLGLRGPKGQRGPRVHDLRHSFAVTRLLHWYRQKANLQAKLPILATYLGHTTVSGTEVYLHTTAELLEEVGRRFHSHFAVPPLSRKRPHVQR
ncbi:MAG: tyrosine-type recombinase/integrase [Verrucomicrobia bacterium]|nr:tyrosine-type recombinase/integrase [Verrucomicrobiota bacterium]